MTGLVSEYIRRLSRKELYDGKTNIISYVCRICKEKVTESIAKVFR